MIHINEILRNWNNEGTQQVSQIKESVWAAGMYHFICQREDDIRKAVCQERGK